jgi:hypothetical protein
MQARLEGRDRHVELIGYALFGESLQFHRDIDLTVLLRNLGEELLDLSERPPLPDEIVRTSRGVPVRVAVEDELHCLGRHRRGHALPLSDQHQGRIARDLFDPGLEAAAVSDRIGLREGGPQDVLQHLLGVPLIAHDTPRDRQDEASVVAVEAGKRGGVPAGQAFDDGLVVDRDGHVVSREVGVRVSGRST